MSDFVVTISDTEITCTRPDGLSESVRWDDLKAVLIQTTDEGPFGDDVFWVLLGNESGCVVPQSATGEKEFLERLQTLPNFDNEAVIEAMSSIDNNQFLCWKKDS